MLRRLGLLLAMLALFGIAGGQWGVVQAVAWARMLHTYTLRTGSVVTAAAQTFDGEHPCALCRQIQAAKQRSRPDGPAAPGQPDDLKVKGLLPDTLPALTSPAADALAGAPFSPDIGAGRTEQPPTPPPRRMRATA